MKNKVFVRGNIISYSGFQLGKSFVTLASDDYEEGAIEVIDGDLILNHNDRIIPYYNYVANGGVTVVGGNIGCLPSPSNVIKLYTDEIEKIERLFHLSVPDDLRSTYNRQLFIGVIGSLELFLTEMISCLVLGDEDYYHAFLEKTNYKISLRDIEEGNLILDRAVYKVIHGINTHKLGDVKNLFQNVFGISFPSTQKIGEYVATRHDLVHRNGNSAEDRTLKYVEIPDEKIVSLIKVCNDFVSELMKALDEPIKKWNDGLL